MIFLAVALERVRDGPQIPAQSIAHNVYRNSSVLNKCKYLYVKKDYVCALLVQFLIWN